MKTWITADWHLGEDRFELMGRPFKDVMAHVITLVNNHNALVKPDDKVIVVGDVLYKKADAFWLEMIAKFNGRKFLVRGNHDQAFSDEQFAPYFDSIHREGEGFYMDLDRLKVYITHYPSEGKEDAFNLVGHVHGAWKYQLNSLNVGVDVHHFRPVDMDTIPFHFNAVDKFYDEDVWVGYNPINYKWRRQRGMQGTYFRPL